MYTIEDQVNNYFNKHGYDFLTYMDVMEDLNDLAELLVDTHAFGDLYQECIRQLNILEDIIHRTFDVNGERIKND